MKKVAKNMAASEKRKERAKLKREATKRASDEITTSTETSSHIGTPLMEDNTVNDVDVISNVLDEVIAKIVMVENAKKKSSLISKNLVWNYFIGIVIENNDPFNFCEIW